MGLFKEFKDFAVRGNAVDLAVGIIIGAAFGSVVSSLVADIIMPPIAAVFDGSAFVDKFVVLREGTPAGPYTTLADARAAGAIVQSYGVFISVFITFLLTTFAVFLIVKQLNRMREGTAKTAGVAATKGCPYCATKIPQAATRCPNCTSQLA